MVAENLDSSNAVQFSVVVIHDQSCDQSFCIDTDFVLKRYVASKTCWP